MEQEKRLFKWGMSRADGVIHKKCVRYDYNKMKRMTVCWREHNILVMFCGVLTFEMWGRICLIK